MFISELKAAYRLAALLGETNLALGELSDEGCDTGAFLSYGHTHSTRSIDITKDEIVGILTARRESLLSQLAAMFVYPDPLHFEIEPAPVAVPELMAEIPTVYACDPVRLPDIAPAAAPIADDEIIF